MNKEQLFTAGVLLFGIIIGYVMNLKQEMYVPMERTACTLEAKLCPDGSSVGRSGPNCEFAQCPRATSTSATSTVDQSKVSTGIEGRVVAGPTCPVEQDPPIEECADKPLSITLALVFADTGKIASLFASNADGSFVLPAKPGRYKITMLPSDRPYPRCDSDGEIVVPREGFVHSSIVCDTGIR